MTPSFMSTLHTPSSPSFQLKENMKSILSILNEKEYRVIQGRYAIDTENKETLEEIGQHYGITRERIRQIEANALRKLERHIPNTSIVFMLELAEGILHENQGILMDIDMKHHLYTQIPGFSLKEVNELHLLLQLSNYMVYIGNTIDYHALWILRENPLPYKEIANKAEKIIKKHKNLINIHELNQKAEISSYGLQDHTLKNILLSKKSLCFSEDKVGMENWRHVNPKTLKDKMLFILNKNKRPLHFRELSQQIKAGQFDHKKCNPQAVHNELIRHDEFVLVGRGLYALKKWGYEKGTVGDIIDQVLQDGKARSREEITQLVLKKKFVKEITVYLNLRNHPHVVRLGRNLYTIKKD